MNWHSDLKQRYAAKGWEAFSSAERAFKQRLDRFCADESISVLDSNPEGKEWMVLLRDGTELYVERRSYETQNEATDFWVGFHPDLGVVAEFLDAPHKLAKPKVIVPRAEISEFSDEW